MTSINNKYNKLWGVWKGKSFPELVTTITFFCRTFPWPAEVLGTFFLFCSLGIFIFCTRDLLFRGWTTQPKSFWLGRVCDLVYVMVAIPWKSLLLNGKHLSDAGWAESPYSFCRCRYKVPNIKVPNHKIPNNKVPNNEILSNKVPKLQNS